MTCEDMLPDFVTSTMLHLYETNENTT